MDGLGQSIYKKGIEQGIEQGIKNLVIFAKNIANSQEIACENLQKMYELSYDEAMEKVEKYWND